MAFERKYLSNVSATGTNGNVFVYCNVDQSGNAANTTAECKSSAFFNEAKDVLRKGTTIIINDGATVDTVAVTTAQGVTPVIVA